MKIAFDIGGVISKYPNEFRKLITCLVYPFELHVITDQHPKEEVIKVLYDNNFGHFQKEYIHCADYEKYGGFAKAVILKELAIDIFIDDFDGYLQWDSSFGPQPILLKVQPDAFKPYWHDDWKTEGGDFGRRRYCGG